MMNKLLPLFMVCNMNDIVFVTGDTSEYLEFESSINVKQNTSYGSIKITNSISIEFDMIYHGINQQSSQSSNNSQNIFYIEPKSNDNDDLHCSSFPSMWLSPIDNLIYFSVFNDDYCVDVINDFIIEIDSIYSIYIEYSSSSFIIYINNMKLINYAINNDINNINKEVLIWISYHSFESANVTINNLYIESDPNSDNLPQSTKNDYVQHDKTSETGIRSTNIDNEEDLDVIDDDDHETAGRDESVVFVIEVAVFAVFGFACIGVACALFCLYKMKKTTAELKRRELHFEKAKIDTKSYTDAENDANNPFSSLSLVKKPKKKKKKSKYKHKKKSKTKNKTDSPSRSSYRSKNKQNKQNKVDRTLTPPSSSPYYTNSYLANKILMTTLGRTNRSKSEQIFGNINANVSDDGVKRRNTQIQMYDGDGDSGSGDGGVVKSLNNHEQTQLSKYSDYKTKNRVALSPLARISPDLPNSPPCGDNVDASVNDSPPKSFRNSFDVLNKIIVDTDHHEPRSASGVPSTKPVLMDNDSDPALADKKISISDDDLTLNDDVYDLNSEEGDQIKIRRQIMQRQMDIVNHYGGQSLMNSSYCQSDPDHNDASPSASPSLSSVDEPMDGVIGSIYDTIKPKLKLSHHAHINSEDTDISLEKMYNQTGDEYYFPDPSTPDADPIPENAFSIKQPNVNLPPLHASSYSNITNITNISGLTAQQKRLGDLNSKYNFKSIDAAIFIKNRSNKKKSYSSTVKSRSHSSMNDNPLFDEYQANKRGHGHVKNSDTLTTIDIRINNDANDIDGIDKSNKNNSLKVIGNKIKKALSISTDNTDNKDNTNDKNKQFVFKSSSERDLRKTAKHRVRSKTSSLSGTNKSKNINKRHSYSPANQYKFKKRNKKNCDDLIDGKQCEWIKNTLQCCDENGWEEYFKNFKKHKITETRLFKLTDDDWKYLIPAIGPRNDFKELLNVRKARLISK